MSGKIRRIGGFREGGIVNESEPKRLAVSVSIEVDPKTSQDELMERLEGALAPLSEHAVRVSDVVVRTVPRFAGAPAGGYETRIWEKATCRTLDNPRDRLEHPEWEVVALREEVTRLSEQAKALGERVARLDDRM